MQIGIIGGVLALVCLHFLIWHFRRISRIKNAIAVQYREQIHDDDVRLPSEKRLSDSVRINVSRQVSRLFQSTRRNSENEPKDQRYDEIDGNKFMENFDSRRNSMAL